MPDDLELMPADASEPRTRVLNARVPMQLYDRLEQEAAQRGVGLAETLRAALYDRYHGEVAHG
jgi:hypothetical protein